jgi:hypothetical protein
LLLEEAALRAGGHRWVESRLFEILGGWVSSTDDLDAKLLFDRHSQHHAWRGDQWWDRLPVLADVDRPGLVVAPSAQVAEVAAALVALEGTIPRLAGAYRLALPRLVAAYEEHRLKASPPSDEAMIRTLDIVLPDAGADWREGEVLLQQRLADETQVQLAADTVARLERLLVKGRGDAVPGPWG